MSSIVELSVYCFGNHAAKQDLKSHGVSAAMMCHIEFTITGIDTVLESYVMIIIVAVEGQIEFIEEKAISLFCVALCLFSLTDHSVVHLCFSFQDWNKKSTQIDACFSAWFLIYVGINSHRMCTSLN